MLTPEQFARALVIKESGGDPHAWGDDDCAVGLYQAHIDWIWTWARHYGLSPLLNERFNDFVRRIVIAFAADHLSYMTPVEVAMYFHKGHKTQPDWDDWDTDYAEKFEAAANRVANA